MGRMKIRKKKPDSYETKILELIDKGKITEGNIYTLRVKHDDWCEIHPCTCDCFIYQGPERLA